MKPKECRDCKKMIYPKTRDAIIQAGYMLGQCRNCKSTEARERARKKRELLKGTWFESKY